MPPKKMPATKQKSRAIPKVKRPKKKTQQQQPKRRTRNTSETTMRRRVKEAKLIDYAMKDKTKVKSRWSWLMRSGLVSKKTTTLILLGLMFALFKNQYARSVAWAAFDKFIPGYTDQFGKLQIATDVMISASSDSSKHMFKTPTDTQSILDTARAIVVQDQERATGIPRALVIESRGKQIAGKIHDYTLVPVAVALQKAKTYVTGYETYTSLLKDAAGALATDDPELFKLQNMMAASKEFSAAVNTLEWLPRTEEDVRAMEESQRERALRLWTYQLAKMMKLANSRTERTPRSKGYYEEFIRGAQGVIKRLSSGVSTPAVS